MVVRNEGMAIARNIRVLLDGRPALEHSLIPRGETESNTLGSGADFRYVLAVSFQSARVVDVVIEWDDDSGRAGKWESQLKVV
jgi:hypothetical protein